MFMKEEKKHYKGVSIKYVKSLGKDRTIDNFNLLLEMYEDDYPSSIKREIVSSIGRHKNNDDILCFLTKNVFKERSMDVVYQMFRTLLYKQSDIRFKLLKDKVISEYNNEVIYKMEEYYEYKHSNIISNVAEKSEKVEATLLEGNNLETLKNIKTDFVHLIFTSPPYYNAREYSGYKNYQEYLSSMKATLEECYRILKPGRYILINVSPVISYRPGREFESTRYPIHFDFHNILTSSGFYFVDEIIWVKPEPSVPYRIGGFQQNKKPLTYKPKTVTESILVYRKRAPFLIDKTIEEYPKDEKLDDNIVIDSSNCWYIPPKYSKNHPAVFPKSLCDKVIQYYSFSGDIICDPFAGIGTVGESAIDLGRVPLLCEINSEYCNYIRNHVLKKSNYL